MLLLVMEDALVVHPRTVTIAWRIHITAPWDVSVMTTGVVMTVHYTNISITMFIWDHVIQFAMDVPEPIQQSAKCVHRTLTSIKRDAVCAIWTG